MSTAMQTDQCQDPTADKPPTIEAYLDTQTGKEESCVLKEKNTKLAYSANRVHRNEQSQPLDVSGIMSAIIWSMGGSRFNNCTEVDFV